MNPQKFWQMVEKDPWLLWVTSIGSLLRSGDFLEFPSLLGERLSPRSIADEITYIAFRPWEKLDLNFKNKGVLTKVEGEATELRDALLSVAIYWHDISKESVQETAFFSQVLKLEKGQTIQEALDSLASGSKVDAVVLMGSMDVRRKKDNDVRGKQLSDLISSWHTVESYDIYRPGSMIVIER